MIKILILLIVFVFLVFLINSEIENFSNVNLKCGTLIKKISVSNVGDSSGDGSEDGSGDGSSDSSGDGTGDGSSDASEDSSGDGASVSPEVNTQVQIETVDPLLPECVGICINQHTYTKDNTKNIFIPSPEFISQRKSNQSEATVMNTRCGECINNFYKGLILMKEQSSDCNL